MSPAFNSSFILVINLVGDKRDYKTVRKSGRGKLNSSFLIV
ncbi:hypothetical protein HMPREF0494_0440 [Limosilactobacillus antri DSM 16041]|uniref:Uncharacterized protein n=1 Tax=Limosilactobacillus antri DSM 16041 TaxID=525309 RepID=C8P546_9LACO|nr:hypothetical protein HMPREF0494_0440 [Limosilactobacillus antri DSM 16041]